MKYKDEVITTTTIEFSILDRLRILFGRKCDLQVRTKTQHLPGDVISESKAMVYKLFPKHRPSGGYEEKTI